MPTYIYMRMHNKELTNKKVNLKSFERQLTRLTSVCIVENQRDEVNSARKNSTDFTKTYYYFKKLQN